ncbi:hypothetical protein ACTHQY_14490 [Rhodococcoides corynebacterioides]|uniref:hypothetical protein n=1 Tax=Rhodococcoides corynebacterioides TaxID=53972 RepID=UPI003F7D14AC
MIPEVLVVTLVVFFGLWAGSDSAPKPEPRAVSKWIIIISGIVAAYAVLSGDSIGPAAWANHWSYLAAVLVVLAISPPFVGSVEARMKHNPRVFDRTRFVPHLVTNILGCAVVVVFIYAAASMPGYIEFVRTFENGAAYDIVFPVSVSTVLAYVEAEQRKNAQAITTGGHQSADTRRYTGWLLSDAHQALNSAYLAFALFIGSTVVLYLFVFSIQASRRGGQGLELSWQLIISISALLAFLTACGLFGSREVPRELARLLSIGADRLGMHSTASKIRMRHSRLWRSGPRTPGAVYMTFLTGMPAALIIGLLWFALMRPSGMRDTVAFLAIGVGYAIYALFSVAAAKREAGVPESHYFTALVLAGLLIVISGSVFYSS